MDQAQTQRVQALAEQTEQRIAAKVERATERLTDLIRDAQDALTLLRQKGHSLDRAAAYAARVQLHSEHATRALIDAEHARQTLHTVRLTLDGPSTL